MPRQLAHFAFFLLEMHQWFWKGREGEEKRENSAEESSPAPKTFAFSFFYHDEVLQDSDDL